MTNRTRVAVVAGVVSIAGLSLASAGSATVYPPDTAATTTPTTTATTLAPTTTGGSAGQGAVTTTLPSAVTAATTTTVGTGVGGVGVTASSTPGLATAASVLAGNLPATGSDSGTPTKIAAGFLAAGLTLAVVANRRKRPAAAGS